MALEFCIYGEKHNKGNDVLWLQLNGGDGNHLWSGGGIENPKTLNVYLGSVYRIWGEKVYSSPQDFLREVPITQRIPQEISKYEQEYKEEGITHYVPEEDLISLIRDADPKSLLR